MTTEEKTVEELFEARKVEQLVLRAKNTGRNYILIEKEKEYIDIINKRLLSNN